VPRDVDARDPQVHIIGHWTYSAGTKKTVYVACNRKSVELFVNGKSLGFGNRSRTVRMYLRSRMWRGSRARSRRWRIRTVKLWACTRCIRRGPAVALRLTPIVNPNGGLRADGSDILLLNVEAVDAKGERCPTFQQRVDFETRGEGIWRGGYNSGKTNSVNHPYLDLECGINRVAVRATRTAGRITVKAMCNGLRYASVTVRSVPIKTENGYSAELPVMPVTPLPAERPVITAAWDEPQIRDHKASESGKFITRLFLFRADCQRASATGCARWKENFDGPRGSVCGVAGRASGRGLCAGGSCRRAV